MVKISWAELVMINKGIDPLTPSRFILVGLTEEGFEVLGTSMRIDMQGWNIKSDQDVLRAIWVENFGTSSWVENPYVWVLKVEAV